MARAKEQRLEQEELERQAADNLSLNVADAGAADELPVRRRKNRSTLIAPAANAAKSLAAGDRINIGRHKGKIVQKAERDAQGNKIRKPAKLIHA